MRAVVADGSGGPEVLRWGEAPEPVPGPEDVLVRVQATGVNRADLLQRAGRYPPPPGASPILGLELAGEVASVGPEVTARRSGDRLMALVTGGGYAEQAAVHEAVTLPVPLGLGIAQAWLGRLVGRAIHRRGSRLPGRPAALAFQFLFTPLQLFAIEIDSFL